MAGVVKNQKGNENDCEHGPDLFRESIESFLGGFTEGRSYRPKDGQEQPREKQAGPVEWVEKLPKVVIPLMFNLSQKVLIWPLYALVARGSFSSR
jgi:hypothetical protein